LRYAKQATFPEIEAFFAIAQCLLGESWILVAPKAGGTEISCGGEAFAAHGGATAIPYIKRAFSGYLLVENSSAEAILAYRRGKRPESR
jgi:hypothetical protein